MSLIGTKRVSSLFDNYYIMIIIYSALTLIHIT